MDYLTLQAMNEDDLGEYLWRRLRHIQPMNPTLDTRFRTEPPESFIIDTLKTAPGQKFRQALIEAVASNLEKLLTFNPDSEGDDTRSEQLASLAYLSVTLNDERLGKLTYLHALALAAQRAREKPLVGTVFIHVLRALAKLQNSARLTPFWLDLFCSESDPAVRSMSFYGLARSDAKCAMRNLAQAVRDKQIDLPVLVWSLIEEYPGIIPLAQAASTLSQLEREKLRDAISRAGASSQVIQDFDLHSDPLEVSPGFRFTVPAPRAIGVGFKRPEFYAPIAA